jgi:hypothetical protein
MDFSACYIDEMIKEIIGTGKEQREREEKGAARAPFLIPLLILIRPCCAIEGSAQIKRL